MGDLSPDGMSIDGNLVPAFTWNAGGLSPGGVNQNGINIHIDIIWVDSIICVIALLFCKCIIGPFLASKFSAAEISSLQYPAKLISSTPSMNLDSISV
jgi:hypothetical protein